MPTHDRRRTNEEAETNRETRKGNQMTDTPAPASSVFISSREKPDNAYGQNGSPQSASLKPGEKKPNIAKVSTPTPVVEGLIPADALAHRTHGEVTPHGGMHPNEGSLSGDVPPNSRPVSKPAPSGAFKRS
jgi:hypothetical protein